MARAVLEIDGDTSGLLAALGAAESAAKKAEDAAKRTGRAYRDSARDGVAAERALVTEANRAVAAHVRAEQQKARAARMSADARKRAEQEATRIAQDEARKRWLSAEQEARVKQNALERFTRLYDAEERRQTAAAEREAAKRMQAWRRSLAETRRDIARERGETARTAERVVGVASSTASGAVGFVDTAMGMVRDARQARAQSDRSLGYAARAAGVSAPATQRRAREFALEHRMTYDEVAAALVAGQERGSVLEAGENQTPAQALDAALETIRMANAEGIDAGQLLAARGRLGAAGLQGASLDEAMRSMIGAAQKGSVEVEQIITEGLPGASRLMNQRVADLGPGASPEARQRAALNAFRESVALQEVAASTGRRAGNTANVLAAVNNALNNPRRQEQILTNITTAAEQANVNDPAGQRRRAALLRFRDEMFERDPTRTGGAMRLRGGVSPLDFASRLAEVTGGNAAAASNILAGTGYGNPQSFQANWRDLVAFLGGQTPTGQTGSQRVREMMNATVSQEKINADAREVENDDLANFNRLEETRLNALTQNTEGIQRLTDRIDQFNARNPLAAPAAGVGAGILAQTLRTAGARALPFVGGAMTLLGVGSDLAAGQSVGRTAVNAAGDLLAGGAAIGGLDRRGGIEAAARRAAAGDRGQQASATNDVLSALGRALTDFNGILRGGITATVSPTDAAHAATQQPSPPTPAR